jgi:predicted nucleotidyltransferase component of viral defense system
LPDKLSLQDLLEVQEFFKLPSPVLVEKDWFVVKALSAINSADLRPFRIVFGGGTALSRAHRLTQRMSEDIDLRFVSDEESSRPARRKLRAAITACLLEAGFEFDPDNKAHCISQNETRYIAYHIPYNPQIAGDGALRPEIKIEITAWPVRLPTVEKSVTSFWAAAHNHPPEIPSIHCVAVIETVAEKFVAMTRRVGEELAVVDGPRDKTLVRHVYDLHATRAHYEAAEVLALARKIMVDDAESYGHKFEAYRENPVAETLRAIQALATDDYFMKNYEDFHQAMVYGEASDFKIAFATVVALSEGLKD